MKFTEVLGFYGQLLTALKDYYQTVDSEYIEMHVSNGMV